MVVLLSPPLEDNEGILSFYGQYHASWSASGVYLIMYVENCPHNLMSGVDTFS